MQNITNLVIRFARLSLFQTRKKTKKIKVEQKRKVVIISLNSKNRILTLLAHSRDTILFFREFVTEDNIRRITGHTTHARNSYYSILTRDRGEESVDSRGFLVRFHAPIIPCSGPMSKTRGRKVQVFCRRKSL